MMPIDVKMGEAFKEKKLLYSNNRRSSVLLLKKVSTKISERCVKSFEDFRLVWYILYVFEIWAKFIIGAFYAIMSVVFTKCFLNYILV